MSSTEGVWFKCPIRSIPGPCARSDTNKTGAGQKHLHRLPTIDDLASPRRSIPPGTRKGVIGRMWRCFGWGCLLVILGVEMSGAWTPKIQVEGCVSGALLPLVALRRFGMVHNGSLRGDPPAVSHCRAMSRRLLGRSPGCDRGFGPGGPAFWQLINALLYFLLYFFFCTLKRRNTRTTWTKIR